MSKVLRLGIAGLGVASTQVLPGISGLPFIDITAAADLRMDALARFRETYHGETYSSVEALCASSFVDAVYVATPSHLHAEHAIAAARQQKHVIVETPMALSIAECAAMNEAAEKYGVKLLCGHMHSFDAPVRRIREIVAGGELGRLRMIHSWNYSDFMYRPRMRHELAMSHGVVLSQAPQQVDIARFIGGGLVRSVRARTGVWDRTRRHEGSYSCFLEFEDGTPATLVYSGYGFFDTAELFGWIGEGGRPRDPETHLKARERLRQLRGVDEEEELKETMRFGSGHENGTGRAPAVARRQPFFGLTLVSCERGDIRQSADGLCIYGEFDTKELALPVSSRGRQAEVQELYDAVMHGRPISHDGRWGEATLEVCLAMIESSQQRKEVFLTHQVPLLDGGVSIPTLA